MAIIPSDEYPGRVVSSPTSYPYGAAQPESVDGANDGFPLDYKWIRDIQGFCQALLAAANIQPTGNAESASSSDYSDAITGAQVNLGAHPIILLDALKEGIAVINDPSRPALTLEIQCNSEAARFRISSSASKNSCELKSGTIAASNSDSIRIVSISPKGFNSGETFGATGPILSAIVSACYDASTLVWQASAEGSSYYTQTDLTISGIGYDADSQIVSAVLRWKLSGGGTASAPITATWKNVGGTLTLDTAIICSQRDPDASGNSGQQLVLTFENR